MVYNLHLNKIVNLFCFAFLIEQMSFLSQAAKVLWSTTSPEKIKVLES